jgi:heptaprenyl diphosphate synthase
LGTDIAELLADTLGRLCQGQVTEVRSAFQITRSRDDYFASISGKTAALTATSCRIGALTGGLPAPEVDACTDFGRCFGMVFQIRDDILDITATDGQLQKPAGQDLAEGIYTLPALVALDDPDSGPDLRALLGVPLGQPERDKARTIVMASQGIAESVAAARHYVDEAQGATAGITQPELREGLSRLAAELLVDLPD